MSVEGKSDQPEWKSSPLRVGDMLYGFCAGHFGRDSYDDKRVEAIGADWVVARDDTGEIHVATFDGGWVVDDLRKFRNPTPSVHEI